MIETASAFAQREMLPEARQALQRARTALAQRSDVGPAHWCNACLVALEIAARGGDAQGMEAEAAQLRSLSGGGQYWSEQARARIARSNGRVDPSRLDRVYAVLAGEAAPAHPAPDAPPARTPPARPEGMARGIIAPTPRPTSEPAPAPPAAAPPSAVAPRPGSDTPSRPESNAPSRPQPEAPAAGFPAWADLHPAPPAAAPRAEPAPAGPASPAPRTEPAPAAPPAGIAADTGPAPSAPPVRQVEPAPAAPPVRQVEPVPAAPPAAHTEPAPRRAEPAFAPPRAEPGPAAPSAAHAPTAPRAAPAPGTPSAAPSAPAPTEPRPDAEPARPARTEAPRPPAPGAPRGEPAGDPAPWQAPAPPAATPAPEPTHRGAAWGGAPWVDAGPDRLPAESLSSAPRDDAFYVPEEADDGWMDRLAELAEVGDDDDLPLIFVHDEAGPVDARLRVAADRTDAEELLRSFVDHMTRWRDDVSDEEAENFYDLGTSFLDMEQWESAVKVFDQAMRNPATRVAAAEGYLKALIGMGDHHAAFGAAGMALGNLAGAGEPLSGILFLRGQAAEAIGDPREARRCYQEALRIDRFYADARERLAALEG